MAFETTTLTEMPRRISLFVCWMGVMASAQTAGAQPNSNAPGVPAAAPVSASAAPATTTAREENATDVPGRSRWWPSAPDKNSRPAPPQESGTPATPADKPAQLLPFQRGVLFLPYVGLSLPCGSNSGSYAAGHTFGVLIGSHLSSAFSVNADISVDYMSPGPLASETQTDFAVSTLIQSINPRRLWILGLKAGVTSFTRSISDIGAYSSSEDSYSATGFVWGGTIGGFVPVGPFALGGLARVTSRHLSSNCDKGEDGTVCKDGRNGINAATSTFTLSVAAMF